MWSNVEQSAVKCKRVKVLHFFIGKKGKRCFIYQKLSTFTKAACLKPAFVNEFFVQSSKAERHGFVFLKKKIIKTVQEKMMQTNIFK